MKRSLLLALALATVPTMAGCWNFPSERYDRPPDGGNTADAADFTVPEDQLVDMDQSQPLDLLPDLPLDQGEAFTDWQPVLPVAVGLASRIVSG